MPADRLLDLPPPEHTPEEARRAADEILSRPEYDWSSGDDRPLLDRVAEPLRRVAEWIADRLESLLSGLGVEVGGVPTWVGWVVLALLVAGVAWLVWRSRGTWRSPGVPDDGADRVLVSVEDDVVDWESEAARCEAEGRWREALRARYRVLVGDLAEREVVGDLVGRTARELVDELRGAAPAAAPAFAAATDLFEDVWYGGAPAGPAERDRLVALADKVRAAVEGRAAGVAVPT